MSEFPDLDKAISASRLRLRMRSPFFATLALFSQVIPSVSIKQAATDGEVIYINVEYLRSLSSAQQDGLILHQVLHMALLHVLRRGHRELERWNIAADIVVNGLIAEQGTFELPPNSLREPSLEKLTVEEIYELLQKQPYGELSLPMADLLSRPMSSQSTDFQQTGSGNGFGSADSTGSGPDTSSSPDRLTESRQAKLETYWRNALQQATVVARSTQQGALPTGVERQLQRLDQAQLDWRSHLWRYLIQTPTDFQGFDRRFIGQGLYLEALQGESVQVYIAVDTSGSIDEYLLKLFLSEVHGIFAAYPHLKGELFYAEAEAYGPYPLDPKGQIPKPKGGGGTSFVPFFDQVAKRQDPYQQGVCVYLTDGYGTFPEDPPELPVLWIVAPGGLDTEQFPFGEAVRLHTT